MNGFVIVNKEFGTYYNGYANFVKDLRDAKIYHTEKVQMKLQIIR